MVIGHDTWIGHGARILRRRFPRAVADALQKTRCWDWTHEMLRQRIDDFKGLRVFLDKYAGMNINVDSIRWNN